MKTTKITELPIVPEQCGALPLDLMDNPFLSATYDV
jgi:hypothetical protein